jgi:hypothetical protein
VQCIAAGLSAVLDGTKSLISDYRVPNIRACTVVFSIGVNCPTYDVRQVVYCEHSLALVSLLC